MLLVYRRAAPICFDSQACLQILFFYLRIFFADINFAQRMSYYH